MKRTSGSETTAAGGFRLTKEEGGAVRVTQWLNDDWGVICWLAPEPGGGMVIRRLGLVPTRGGSTPSGGVTAALVRQINIGAIRREAMGFNRQPQVSTSKPKGRRRSPETIAYWERLAARRSQLLRDGAPNVDVVLASEFDRNYSTVRTDIARAIKAGYFHHALLMEGAKISDLVQAELVEQAPTESPRKRVRRRSLSGR